MPYVAPATVVSGTTITTAWGNAVKTGMDYQANAPCCRVFHSAVQAVADGGETTMLFNSEQYDPTGMHSTVTNTNRITMNDAGVYVVTFTCEIAAAADYLALRARLVKNGTVNLGGFVIGTLTDSGVGPLITLTIQEKFAATDWVEARVYQNNSASASRNVLVTSGLSPYFSAAWVALG